MKAKILMLVVFLVISGVSKSQEILNQYLVTAAKNNPVLKAKFNEYNATLEKIPQEGTLPDPTLAFGYFILPVETKNGPQQAKFSFSQMFPWFGTLSSREDIYVNAAKSKYEDFEEAKISLFFDVKSAYYELYFIQKSIDITIDNIRILNTFKNLALIKISAGTASGVDEIRVEMELADLENNLALFRDSWFATSVKFNKLLNVSSTSEIVIPNKLWDYELGFSRQAVLDSLQKNNHQLMSLEFLRQSFVSKERQAKKQGNPNIILGADYTMIGDNGITPDGGKDALFIKVGITIPLYRKKYSAMVNESVFQQKVVEDKKVGKINALETLFEKAYSEYADAQRRVVLYGKQSTLADRAISILESEYASNGKNFEEILRMEKNLLKYKLELEKARGDKQVAIAFINYLMG
jgi:outer membrane protein TolC